MYDATGAMIPYPLDPRDLLDDADLNAARRVGRHEPDGRLAETRRNKGRVYPFDGVDQRRLPERAHS